MTAAVNPFGIPSAAMPAWVSLSTALEHLVEDEGRNPVCATSPDSWSADAKPAVRRQAADACTFCPVQLACAAYAQVGDEKQGVWGGVDRGQRPTPTRKRKAA
jgi:hypothetical protein